MIILLDISRSQSFIKLVELLAVERAVFVFIGLVEHLLNIVVDLLVGHASFLALLAACHLLQHFLDLNFRKAFVLVLVVLGENTVKGFPELIFIKIVCIFLTLSLRLSQLVPCQSFLGFLFLLLTFALAEAHL